MIISRIKAITDRLDGSTEKKLVSLYLFALFSVFPMYLLPERLQGITFRWILFSLLTLVTVAAYIILLFKKKAFCRKRLYRIDICMILVLLLSIGQTFLCMLQGKENRETYFLLSVCVLSYFAVSALASGTNDVCKLVYLDVFLTACWIIYLELMVRLFLVPQHLGVIGLLTQERTHLQSFLLLSNMICVLQYCFNRKLKKDGWYLLTAVIGFFLQLVQKNMINILLMGSLFLIIPLLFLPTAELFRRNLIMAFLFFLVLSNMPLVTNNTNLLKTGVQFDIKNSMYLYLIITLAGIIVLSYWERIPKGIPLDHIVMKRMQKIFLSILELYLVFLVCICFTDWPAGMEGRIGGDIFAALFNSIKTGVSQIDGTFGQMLGEYGLGGGVLSGMICVAIISRLRRSYSRSPESALFTTIAIMYLIQSFFYKQQIVTTPIYVVLVTTAVFQEKNRNCELRCKEADERNDEKISQKTATE